MKTILNLFILLLLLSYSKLIAQSDNNAKIASPTGTNKICLPCGGGGGGGGTPALCNSGNTTLFVDRSRPNDTGDGLSWATAKKELTTALDFANSCSYITRINVAEGMYQPVYTNSPANYKDFTFFIGDTYSLYGGYPSGGGTRDHATNPTILFGRGGPNGTTEFVHHVLVVYDVASAVTIDGFQIKNGNADGSGSIELDATNTMKRYEGGGIYLKEVGNITIKNCVITANQATVNGGAIYAANTNLTLYNTIISNSRAEYGPAVYLTGAETHSSRIFNSTISDVGLSGGMIYKNGNNSVEVRNCILWENINPTVWAGSGDYTVYNSIINMDNTLNQCINTNPIFVDIYDKDGPDNIWLTADDGLRVAHGSPAINRGQHISSPNVSVDIANEPREFGLPDIGAYELQKSPVPDVLAENGDLATVKVYDLIKESAIAKPNTNVIIANILPNGANPATESITAKAFVSTTDLSEGGNQLVNRHYEITPDIEPNTATARVSLFFDNSEFIEYNGRRFVNEKLPEYDLFSPRGADVSKLRIVKYGGTSSTGLPGSYSGETTIIDPDDSDIIYTGGHWKISFDVTGFSGFFVTTAAATPLPITLLNFTAKKVENSVKLNWQTTNETNFSHFDIERSFDAKKFEKIGEETSNESGNYEFLDHSSLTTHHSSLFFYRLKMVDLDGKFNYSKTIAVDYNAENEQIGIFPNPVQNKLYVKLSKIENLDKLRILDIKGQLIQESNQTDIDISKLVTGKYFIQIIPKSGQTIVKSFLKE